jgi:hypothetical protein
MCVVRNSDRVVCRVACGKYRCAWHTMYERDSFLFAKLFFQMIPYLLHFSCRRRIRYWTRCEVREICFSVCCRDSVMSYICVSIDVRVWSLAMKALPTFDSKWFLAYPFTFAVRSRLCLYAKFEKYVSIPDERSSECIQCHDGGSHKIRVVMDACMLAKQ